MYPGCILVSGLTQSTLALYIDEARDSLFTNPLVCIPIVLLDPGPSIQAQSS